MVCGRPSFALQKAANRTLKGRLLEAKRRPFANSLTVNELQSRVYGVVNGLQLAVKPTARQRFVLLRHLYRT